MGNDTTTSFLLDPWVEGSYLLDRFPQLFQVSDQWGERVVDMGYWVGDRGSGF